MQASRRIASVPRMVHVRDGHPKVSSFLTFYFGTNFKGQLAAVVLFNIVNGNGNALREGWTQVRTFRSSHQLVH